MPDSSPRLLSISYASWLRLAIVACLTYAFFKISGVVLVLLIAIFISAAINPILEWAKRQGIPRILMVVLVYIIAIFFLFVFFYFLLLPLIGEVSSFLKTLTIYSNSVASDNVLSRMFVNQEVFGTFHSPVFAEKLGSYLSSFSEFLSQGLFSTASLVFGGVLNFILIVVLSFYLSVQDDGVTKFIRIIVPLPYEKYIVNLWKRSQHKIGVWMQGQFILGLLVAALVYVSLTIVGVPNALLFAVLTGAFEIIPIFGPLLAALPAVFSAYDALGAPTGLIVALIFLLIQQLESHVFYPLVVKKVVGIPPLVSILALFVGGELGGFLGILISVPAAVVIMEILEDLEQRKLGSSRPE